MPRRAGSARKGTGMAVRKLPNSWQYDFTISGFGRQRQGGFTTKAEAVLAEKRAREDLLSGARRIVFRDGHAEYMAATRMKDRSRDASEHLWKRIPADESVTTPSPSVCTGSTVPEPLMFGDTRRFLEKPGCRVRGPWRPARFLNRPAQPRSLSRSSRMSEAAMSDRPTACARARPPCHRPP